MEAIVGLICALMASWVVAFILWWPSESESRKEAERMYDMGVSVDKLSEAFAELGSTTEGTCELIVNEGVWATISCSAVDEYRPLVARVCPQCGAPVRGDECDYCGSVFKG